MTPSWRLSVYDIARGVAVRFATPGHRYLYVIDGTCRIDSPAGTRALAGSDGAVVEAGSTATSDGSAWLCEAVPADGALLDPSAAFVVLSKTLVLPEAGPRLFRVDRVDLPPGAVTPRHFHRGPGIRRLISGRVRVEIGADIIGIDPGAAWFEPGDEPVLGANAAPGPSAFLRVLLLPVELSGGKGSFVPASDADAAKPRAVEQRILHEASIDLA
jgi:quercetin dioxygenase-like cupin family protein